MDLFLWNDFSPGYRSHFLASVHVHFFFLLEDGIVNATLLSTAFSCLPLKTVELCLKRHLIYLYISVILSRLYFKFVRWVYDNLYLI